MPTQMRPHRQQISQMLALSGRHPLKLEPRVDSPAFPSCARVATGRVPPRVRYTADSGRGLSPEQGVSIGSHAVACRGLTRLSDNGVVGIEKGARS